MQPPELGRILEVLQDLNAGKEDRTVRRNERQENTERFVERREKFANVHFDELNACRNDENVHEIGKDRKIRCRSLTSANTPDPDRERCFRTKDEVRDRPAKEGRDRHDERDGTSHSKRSTEFPGAPKKRTDPNEIFQYEIIDDGRADDQKQHLNQKFHENSPESSGFSFPFPADVWIR